MIDNLALYGIETGCIPCEEVICIDISRDKTLELLIIGGVILWFLTMK